MNDTCLAFHPLSFVPEHDEVIVGRPDIDSYIVLPADGAAALVRMTQGMSPSDTAAWYESEYGQALDIDDFLSTLRDLLFVREEDEAESAIPPRHIRFQPLGRAVFSPVAFALYASLAALWLVTVLRHPQYLPRPQQMFFTSSILAVELVAVFGQIPWLFAHEAFHALAGRRLGLPSKLGVGTRLYFVVFETHMSGLLTLPRSKRYFCYLAGMLLDVLAVCGLGLVGFALRGATATTGLIGRLSLALAFPIVTRLFYQFILFLQTDLYYVFATVLGCHDLHSASRAVVMNRLRRAVGMTRGLVDESDWSDRDLRVARVYSPLLALGVCVLVGVWIWAVVPIAWHMWTLLVEGLRLGAGDLAFWDRSAFVVLNLAQIGLLIYVSHRNRTRAGGSRGE